MSEPLVRVMRRPVAHSHFLFGKAMGELERRTRTRSHQDLTASLAEGIEKALKNRQDHRRRDLTLGREELDLRQRGGRGGGGDKRVTDIVKGNFHESLRMRSSPGERGRRMGDHFSPLRGVTKEPHRQGIQEERGNLLCLSKGLDGVPLGSDTLFKRLASPKVLPEKGALLEPTQRFLLRVPKTVPQAPRAIQQEERRIQSSSVIALKRTAHDPRGRAVSKCGKAGSAERARGVWDARGVCRPFPFGRRRGGRVPLSMCSSLGNSGRRHDSLHGDRRLSESYHYALLSKGGNVDALSPFLRVQGHGQDLLFVGALDPDVAGVEIAVQESQFALRAPQTKEHLAHL
mmetsp:Transcript_6072/g.14839  ORF Transcript_6072/g.14839 Transcript_6072/m.14839 type:complete len:345 (+) Transcript_6072:240-1274(+)